MISVELRHEKPKDETFKIIKSTQFNWPETLDEFNEEQFIAYIETLESQQLEDVAKIELFFKLSKCSKWFVRRRMTPDEFKIQIVEGLVDPLLKNPSMSRGILRNAVKGFEGMSDTFDNFTWGQYALVDAYFNKYNQGHSELLDSICALIYVPKGQKFDAELADEYLPFWSEKPHALKRAVVINYSLMKKFIADEKWYPNLFKMPVKNDPNSFNLSSGPKEIDYQEVTILLSGGPFGNREALDREPVHNVLKYLDIKMKPKPKKKHE